MRKIRHNMLKLWLYICQAASGLSVQRNTPASCNAAQNTLLQLARKDFVKPEAAKLNDLHE